MAIKMKHQITFNLMKIESRGDGKWIRRHHPINSNPKKVNVSSTLVSYIIHPSNLILRWSSFDHKFLRISYTANETLSEVWTLQATSTHAPGMNALTQSKNQKPVHITKATRKAHEKQPSPISLSKKDGQKQQPSKFGPWFSELQTLR